MRATILAAGGLACAGAAMTIAAFAAGGGDDPPARPAAATAVAAAEMPRGLQVFLEQGCGSCHRFEPAESVGPIGPDLTHSLRGMPTGYIRQSIVDPNAVAAAGYGTGAMPEDYAERIAPGDLDALVDYLGGGYTK